MIHSNAKLGQIIKESRETAKLTREDLSEITGISVRYIAAIENEGKKPRFEVLCRLITSLGIDANTIFYPSKNTVTDEKQQLFRMIECCDEHEYKIISAVVYAVLKQ